MDNFRIAPQRLSRRKFLYGMGALGTVSALNTQAFGGDPFAVLARKLQGDLIRPGDAGYHEARLPWNLAYADVFPAAVARCKSASDIAETLRFARQHALPFTARSGGHSTAGFSTSPGIIIDTSHLNTAAFHDDGTLTLGAGVRNMGLYTAASEKRLAVPAGTCPTVGVAGLVLGGGMGPFDRLSGLTCDHLIGLKMVDAEGNLFAVDTDQHPDLFWACRGGGGGNFGIVTELKFRPVPIPQEPATIFRWVWPWKQASTLVQAWQDWAPDAPRELYVTCQLLYRSQMSPAVPADLSVSLIGEYQGSAERLEKLLMPVLESAGKPTTEQFTQHSDFLSNRFFWAKCHDGLGASVCGLPGLARVAASSKSQMFNRLDQAGIDIAISWFAQAYANPLLSYTRLTLDPLGGAMADVDASATAFVHRHARFWGSFNVLWPSGAASEVVEACRAWHEGFYQSIRPYSTGAAYQNFVDPQLLDWQIAYYGNNLSRLAQVKQSYDPHGVFHFLQSIPLRL